MLGIGLNACKNRNDFLGKIDFQTKSGIFIAPADIYIPDSTGVLISTEIEMPPFINGGFFSSDGMPVRGFLPGNRNHFWLIDSSYHVYNKPHYVSVMDEVPFFLLQDPVSTEGNFSVFLLSNDQYLVLLPLPGINSVSWIDYGSETPVVLSASLGTDTVHAEIPVLAWHKSTNLYDACYQVWKLAVQSGIPGISASLRDQKHYPEMFNYLGWCTWEEYKHDISEDIILNAIHVIERSGIPVRFLLIDNGHEELYTGNYNNHRKSKLMSFDPNPVKFPNGWDPIISEKSNQGIKWIGLWQHQSGYFNGLSEDNKFSEEIKTILEMQPGGKYLPAVDSVSLSYFYRSFMQSIKNHGFDFAKIDFQSEQFADYIGSENAALAHAITNNIMEDDSYKHNLPLLNCIAQDIVSVMNTKYSAVTRCSQDYRKGEISNARIHLLQSYHNMLWMGQTIFGDHDMFHSSDHICGEEMAVSKAMSCAPVYLSDNPEDFVPDYILPLCLKDGKIIKPLSPAFPLPGSLFSNPLFEKNMYKVIAPMPNKAASVVCYNLYELGDATITGTFDRKDYCYANGLIQPFVNNWSLPDEGLAIYDWKNQKIYGPGEMVNVQLEGFSNQLFHLIPVQKGIALIGLINKYLSPATVESVEYGEYSVSFSLSENGAFALYVKKGIPESKNVKFVEKEKHLWIGYPDWNLSPKDMSINIMNENTTL